MSSSVIDKVTSSTKSFIETFTSSENPTTTFTDHTVESVTAPNGIVQKVLAFVSQPKFKWYLLGLLLCVVAFIYFKFQNKKPKKENFNVEKNQQGDDVGVKPEDQKEEIPLAQQVETKENITMLLQERDKEWVNKINNMKQQYNVQLTTQADVNSKLMTQIQQLQEQNKQSLLQMQEQQRISQQQMQQMQQQLNTQPQKQNKQQNMEELTDSSSSDEIFIEDKNIMEHNLTAEEMKAIDRQLEDVNIDHLMHASD